MHTNLSRRLSPRLDVSSQAGSQDGPISRLVALAPEWVHCLIAFPYFPGLSMFVHLEIDEVESLYKWFVSEGKLIIAYQAGWYS